MDLRKVCGFLDERQSRGTGCVLVTVCAVEGSSMRGPGTIMGVAEDGSFAGSLSGGCIENAVVAEALEALRQRSPRLVRFGAGSPYLDIKLPCGGGLDLQFSPLGTATLPRQCLAAIARRQPFSIGIENGSAHFLPDWRKARFDPDAQSGHFGHWPEPRLVIAGHGAGVEALADLAQTMGCSVAALTPDAALADRLTMRGIPALRLARTTHTDLLQSDPWTGIAFVFHDHEWEIDLMARALSLPHFYLGAMGGRTAHARRCEALSAKGVSDAQIAAIRAPIGLFHSSRDPQTLALSTLAEVIRAYHQCDFEARLG
ncbi:XdhC family protein [Qipengyuania sp. ASV99]|uniref:XdhC family protein n=1 Tax=Qipengyuania sp. ASV99 TaxID=3399681 RepID=UPI003A4C79C3